MKKMKKTQRGEKEGKGERGGCNNFN